MPEIKSGRKPVDVRLFIAILAGDWKEYCDTGRCITEFTLDCVQAGLRTPKFLYLTNEAIVTHARNVAIMEFMLSDCTDLIYVDNDVSWRRDAPLRLISHPVDIVGGAYRKKVPDETYAVRWIENEAGEVQGSDPATGLLEVRGLPAGFVRITRRAIQRMINELRPIQYKFNRGHYGDTPVYKIFDHEYVQYEGEEYHDLITEDYAFCESWRKLGGKVWVDPDMRVNHHGHFAYQGHLASHIREQAAPAVVKVAA